MNPVLLLPAELPVQEEVLGQSFEVRIDGVNLTLTFPIHNPTGFVDLLVDPRMPGGNPGWPYQDIPNYVVEPGPGMKVWGAPRNSFWEVWTLAASLLAQRVPRPRDAPEVQMLLDVFLPWFLRAREWILVCHGYPRSGLRDTRQDFIVAYTPSGERWSRGAGMTVHLAPAGMPAQIAASIGGGSSAEIRSAFARATRDESPPSQSVLLLDARTAAAEGDFRRAVIYACAAAEVSLATAIRELLSQAGLNPDVVGTVVKQADGLVGLIDLYVELGGNLTVSKGKAKDRLAGRRNDAAHAGLIPSDTETWEAVECADAIVTSATPLLFP